MRSSTPSVTADAPPFSRTRDTALKHARVGIARVRLNRAAAPVDARCHRNSGRSFLTTLTTPTSLTSLTSSASPTSPASPAFLASPTSWHLDIKDARHHDAYVRTTLTLEPEIAARLKSEVRRTGRPLKTVVNEALRRGLGLMGKPSRHVRFEVRPHAFGFRPGIDLERLNQLADELDTEEAARKLRS